ncbi:MAG: hypothetical protein NVV62_19805 [Terricaulis sp.]|nr:hypothetical protein [Terricaulis sp.]
MSKITAYAPAKKSVPVFAQPLREGPIKNGKSRNQDRGKNHRADERLQVVPNFGPIARARRGVSPPLQQRLIGRAQRAGRAGALKRFECVENVRRRASLDHAASPGTLNLK